MNFITLLSWACCTGIGITAWIIIRNRRKPADVQLTTCPACAAALSAEANQCPQCGQPLRRWARGRYAVKLVIVLVMVLAAGWFLVGTALDMHHAAEGPLQFSVHAPQR